MLFLAVENNSVSLGDEGQCIFLRRFPVGPFGGECSLCFKRSGLVLMVATYVIENYILNRKRVDRVQREIDEIRMSQS